MSVPEHLSGSPRSPRRPRFQFGLRTMLLLFVVLGSSMAVFGVAGFVVFLLVVALAVYVRESESPYGLLRVVIALICLAGLMVVFLECGGYLQKEKMLTRV